ncbi:MAG: M50 family metallopeptidase [Holosporales bacterium]|nr:M50 family metallopeptidase [Holosporales bacterium]
MDILAFALLLGIVIVVHELGHLMVARSNGVFCSAFSLGFGPILFSKKDKLGTQWRLSLFPFGGYVKMFGDADVSSFRECVPEGASEEDMERMSLHRKRPWQKLLIAAAGPVANFLLSIVLFSIVFAIKGAPEYGNLISIAKEDSLAYVSGLRDGDRITRINSVETNDFKSLKKEIINSRGKRMIIEFERGGFSRNISINMFERKGEELIPIEFLGVSPKEALFKKLSVLEALKAAIVETYVISVDNIVGVFKIITRKADTKNVGGVLSLFKMSSISVQSGFTSFISMIAMISALLGAMNLLPIPLLDGGAVAISLIEWCFGRPLNKKLIGCISMAGLAIVAGLMSLGIWNDLSNCKFFNWFK